MRIRRWIVKLPRLQPRGWVAANRTCRVGVGEVGGDRAAHDVHARSRHLQSVAEVGIGATDVGGAEQRLPIRGKVGDESILVAGPAVDGPGKVRGEGRTRDPNRPVGSDGHVLPRVRATASNERGVAKYRVNDERSTWIVIPQPQGDLTRSLKDVPARDDLAAAPNDLVGYRGQLPDLAEIRLYDEIASFVESESAPAFDREADPARVTTRGHDKVVLQHAVVTVVGEIGAGVHFSIGHSTEVRHVAPPFRGVGPAKRMTPPRKGFARLAPGLRIRSDQPEPQDRRHGRGRPRRLARNLSGCEQQGRNPGLQVKAVAGACCRERAVGGRRLEVQWATRGNSPGPSAAPCGAGSRCGIPGL